MVLKVGVSLLWGFALKAAYSWGGAIIREETVFRVNIQLFRERLSEKVHATIPNGIAGGFSLFIKEICKNGTRDHGLMFAIAKGKQQM